MILEDFILEGEVAGIKIGKIISSSSQVELIQNEEGDIPGLYSCTLENLYFEITTFSKIVIGIQFDFSYDAEKVYGLCKNNHTFFIGFNTTYEKAQKSLKILNVDFKKSTVDDDNFELTLLKSGVSLLFFRNNLNKASIFSMDDYNALSSTF